MPSVQANNIRASGRIVPHEQAGDVTAPDRQSSITIEDHIAKRAPSRHDIPSPMQSG